MFQRGLWKWFSGICLMLKYVFNLSNPSHSQLYSQESSNYLFDKLRVAGWVQGQPFKRIKKIVSNHSRPSRGTCSITHATQAGGPSAKWPASELSMDTHAVRAYQVWPKREREVRWRSSPTKKVTGSFGQAGGTPEFVGKVFPLLGLKKKFVFSCVKAKFLDFSCPELTLWQH